MNPTTILHQSYHGLHIFSHILSLCYQDKIVIELVGHTCKPSRNPFNHGRPTLLISLQDEIFCYQDSELESFKGTAFDFAALYYNLAGDALLEKIGQELKLLPESVKDLQDTIERWESRTVEKESPRFSFFYSPISNTLPYASISLLDLYYKIKNTCYQPRTERLRSIAEPVTAAKFKQKSLDYVTFAGEFTSRCERGLVKPSGLMVIDFDKVDDLPWLKGLLLLDPNLVTELLFTSPSGKGLKWVITTDLSTCSHGEYFTAVAQYLEAQYQLKVDRSGKDVSRACFLCHDPHVYINPDYL